MDDNVYYRKQFVYHYGIFYLLRSVFVYAAFLASRTVTVKVREEDDFYPVAEGRLVLIFLLPLELLVGIGIVHAPTLPVNEMLRTVRCRLAFGIVIYAIFCVSVIIGVIVDSLETVSVNFAVCVHEFVLRLPDFICYIYLLPIVQEGRLS